MLSKFFDFYPRNEIFLKLPSLIVDKYSIICDGMPSMIFMFDQSSSHHFFLSLSTCKIILSSPDVSHVFANVKIS